MEAEWRTSGSGGAHLDDALAGAGDVGVFLAELAVREHLHFVFAAGQFLQDFTEFTHAEGFRLPVGLHAGHFDDDFFVGRELEVAATPSNRPQAMSKANARFMFLHLVTVRM